MENENQATPAPQAAPSGEAPKFPDTFAVWDEGKLKWLQGEPKGGVCLYTTDQLIHHGAALVKAERSAVTQAAPSEPVAWARKWHVDGEKPEKQKNSNNRLSWGKFKLLPITPHRCLPDDVPLYPPLAAQQSPADARDAALEEAAKICDGQKYADSNAAGLCANYIRALKGAAATTSTEGRDA